MNDRFTIGFLAGMLAGIPTQFFNWGAYYLHMTTLRWVDIMGILIFGKTPTALGETLLGIVWVYFYLGVLGIFFTFIILKITSRNYILKAVVFSVFISLAVHSAVHLFKVPELVNIPLKTSIINLLGALVWGLSLGYTLSWLNNKTKSKQKR
ncbi:MAG TPA: hypothetical protein VNT57_00090 [Desulfobacteria bacterium]|nr:hypothetical protein [Desulfobacteria bacterium]